MKLKRCLSLMLVLATLLCTVPMTVWAESKMITGVSATLYSVSAENTIAETGVTALGAFDEEGRNYTEVLDKSHKWYYMYYNEQDIPEDEVGFERYDFDYEGPLNHVFVKPVASESERFDTTKQYLCEVTLHAPDGAVFAVDANICPGAANVREWTNTKVTLAIEVFPDKESQLVENLTIKVDADGYLTVPDSLEMGYAYAYKCWDGSYDSVIFDQPIATPVGKTVINTCDYQLLTDNTIDMTHPQVVVVVVDLYEWYMGGTAAIYGYGVTALRLSDPVIEVNNLIPGESVEVASFGSQKVGAYSINIASATFDGWFADADGTFPVTADAESYVVFTIYYSGLFVDDITAGDVLLKYGADCYAGAKIIAADSGTTMRVSFLIPSDNILLTIQTITPGGTAYFWNSTIQQGYIGQSNISIKKDVWGRYPDMWIRTEAYAGYYLKSVKVNGEEYPIKDRIPPLKLSPTESYEWSFPYHFTSNGVITAEFEVVDIVRPIVPNGYLCTSDKEYLTNEYYVAQGFDTFTCGYGSVFNEDASIYPLMWNTEPDGSGLTLKDSHGYVKWPGDNPYNNGKQDIINIYPIMMCNTHKRSAQDVTEWIEIPGSDAECGEDGVKAHQVCPTCGICRIEVEGKAPILGPVADMTIKSAPHDFTKPTDNGNGTHSQSCTKCDHTETATHAFIDGVCECGAKEGEDYLKGDCNGDGEVTDADATYLLFYTIFPDDYPINGYADYNHDGEVTDADATYLLFFTIFPEDYPLE